MLAARLPTRVSQSPDQASVVGASSAPHLPDSSTVNRAAGSLPHTPTGMQLSLSQQSHPFAAGSRGPSHAASSLAGGVPLGTPPSPQQAALRLWEAAKSAAASIGSASKGARYARRVQVPARLQWGGSALVLTQLLDGAPQQPSARPGKFSVTPRDVFRSTPKNSCLRAGARPAFSSSAAAPASVVFDCEEVTSGSQPAKPSDPAADPQPLTADKAVPAPCGAAQEPGHQASTEGLPAAASPGQRLPNAQDNGGTPIASSQPGLFGRSVLTGAAGAVATPASLQLEAEPLADGLSPSGLAAGSGAAVGWPAASQEAAISPAAEEAAEGTGEA